MKRILVCGSRALTGEHWGTRIHMMLTAVADYEEVEIIHGDALGADTWAAHWAKENRVPCRAFPADWATYGKRAGVIRNLQMLDEKPDLVVAFWDGESKGTKHTIDQARERDIPVEVICCE